MAKNSKIGGLGAARSLTLALTSKNRKRRKLFCSAADSEERRAPRRNNVTPELKLVRRPISQLKNPARSARKHDRGQIIQLKRSIETLGMSNVALIDGDDRIIDGVGLVEAAQEVGIDEIYCIVIDHLSKPELRKLRLALNRLGEKGEWDLGELQIELQELNLEFGAELEIPGFEAAEIDDIARDDEDIGRSELDAVPPLDKVAVSQEGDLWLLARHRLVCGDARSAEVITIAVGHGVVLLILTDPPYGVAVKGHITHREHREFVMGGKDMSSQQLLQFFTDSLNASVQFLIDGGLCLSFIDWRGLSQLVEAAETAGLTQINLVVWAKSNAGMGSLYRSQHELLPVFKKGTGAHVNNIKLGLNGRWRSNLWEYPGASSFGSEARNRSADHPTPKPVAMLEDAIYDLSNRGDIVLDPFLGSGSTLIAAEKSGRQCCGVELDPLYCDVTLRRWAALTGEEPILHTTGQTFSEVERVRNVGSLPLLPKPRVRIKASSDSEGGAND